MEAVPSSFMLSRLTRPMVVGPFRPAMRRASVVDSSFASSLEAASEAASGTASLEAALDATELDAAPPQAARLSARARASSMDVSFFMQGFPLSSQDRAILCLKILHRTMGRSFHIFYKANLQNHLLCGSKFTIIESKIPLRVQRNCRRAVGSRIFPTEL